MQLSRADTSLLARWWFSIDRVLLGLLAALVAIGLLVSLAASPAVALKKGFHAFHFVERQIVHAALGAIVMVLVSTLEPRRVRRLSLALFVIAGAAMVAVLLIGEEVNGARRWLRLAGHSLQPSEMAKPAFVVLSAWCFAEAGRRPDMPALSIAVALLAAFTVLLVLQPDVGQTILIVLVWGILLVVSGRPARAAGLLGAAAAAGLAAAYWTFDHVRRRIDSFLDPVPGEHSQTERAIQSFTDGGFLGRGPGEGTIKTALPDAHTDFIFAVIAEEYGVIACLLIAGLFAAITLRTLARALDAGDPFMRLAAIGLTLAFALQALINMGVNVGLLPAKGMTLPLVSAGGSSILSVAVTMGMLLALTRRRPDPARIKMPPLALTEEPTISRRP
jgi:cell division protein FtsW